MVDTKVDKVANMEVDNKVANMGVDMVMMEVDTYFCCSIAKLNSTVCCREYLIGMIRCAEYFR